MPGKADWEKFFDGHAPVYMDNCFTQNTINEVDFLVEELRLKPGATILDVGCGTGRHSVELARRGFAVTGVDLSDGMLAEARKHAAAGRGRRHPYPRQRRPHAAGTGSSTPSSACARGPSASWGKGMMPWSSPWPSCGGWPGP